MTSSFHVFASKGTNPICPTPPSSQPAKSWRGVPVFRGISASAGAMTREGRNSSRSSLFRNSTRGRNTRGYSSMSASMEYAVLPWSRMRTIGFRVDFRYEEDPNNYAGVRRGGVCLHVSLRQRCGRARRGVVRRPRPQRVAVATRQVWVSGPGGGCHQDGPVGDALGSIAWR
jgi:hypothetical protein